MGISSASGAAQFAHPSLLSHLAEGCTSTLCGLDSLVQIKPQVASSVSGSMPSLLQSSHLHCAHSLQAPSHVPFPSPAPCPHSPAPCSSSLSQAHRHTSPWSGTPLSHNHHHHPSA